MGVYSQIANTTSTGHFCILQDASVRDLRHNADMDTDKNGGANYLQAWREFRRMSREELASKVGTTGAVIWHLEEGQRGLSAKWLRRLAPALRTTPGFLLDHNPNDLPTDVLEIWGAVPDSDKEKAIAVLRAFARNGTDG